MGFFSSKKDEIERLKNQLEMQIEKSNRLNDDYAQQVQKNNDLRNQLQKANQISEDYNKVTSKNPLKKTTDTQKRGFVLSKVNNQQ